MARAYILVSRILPKRWSKCIQIIFCSHLGKFCEYIPHVFKRINASSLTRYYYRVYNSRSLTCFWMTNKKPILFAYRRWPNCIFYQVIIYTSFSMLDMCNQGLPVFCLLYTSPSPRDRQKSRMPSSA